MKPSKRKTPEWRCCSGNSRKNKIWSWSKWWNLGINVQNKWWVSTLSQVYYLRCLDMKVYSQLGFLLNIFRCWRPLWGVEFICWQILESLVLFPKNMYLYKHFLSWRKIQTLNNGPHQFLMLAAAILENIYLVPQRTNFFKWMQMVISKHFLCKELVHHPIETTT